LPQASGPDSGGLQLYRKTPGMDSADSAGTSEVHSMPLLCAEVPAQNEIGSSPSPGLEHQPRSAGLKMPPPMRGGFPIWIARISAALM